MKIAMFNLKGGQGKSSIALNPALTFKTNVISNGYYHTIRGSTPRRQF
jgi:hypothetical protein